MTSISWVRVVLFSSHLFVSFLAKNIFWPKNLFLSILVKKTFCILFDQKKTFVSFLTNKDFSLLNKIEIQLPLIEILYECYFGQLGRCLVVSAKSGKRSVIGYPVASRPAGWIPTVGSRSRSAESLFFAPTGALVSKTPHYNRSDSTHFLRFSAKQSLQITTTWSTRGNSQNVCNKQTNAVEVPRKHTS